ncbi:hypothetical protein SAMN05421505_113170 [Sinosporangium album]|uniref:Uncharacterized protein n=1 Tax=Sinosporangium album TaxID=504805 RepID=A0A1G8B6U7_9ACTN|nr:DUF6328 family protein [Sinosporangium album]SDH28854.1 hypothetical protein SAMN05421505_113170 [Sinosporangium album]
MTDPSGDAPRDAQAHRRDSLEAVHADRGRPGTGEGPRERVNRELMELLQELRVAVTGVQVMFAFLLTIPFAAGFGKVDTLGKWLFFVALMGSAFASICFIAPAAQHRVLFRTGSKAMLLRRANTLGIAGAIFLSLAMTAAVALVAKAVLESWPFALFAAAVAGASVWLWLLQPLRSLRHPRGARFDEERPGAAPESPMRSRRKP